MWLINYFTHIPAPFSFLHSLLTELIQMGICSFLLPLLLFITSAQVMYYAQGNNAASKHQPEMAKDIVSSMTIGSRPPRCEGRCSSCGRCEAVLVFVAPNDRRGRKSADSLSDDTSNYKPMSWKCKCGERIFNP